MRVGLVLGTIGHLLRAYAFLFVVPLLLAAWDAAHGRDAWFDVLPFVVAGVVAWGAGMLLVRWGVHLPRFRRSEALAVVSGSWLAVALLGGIPYLFSGLGPVDAFFESMSGFTTTGATILTDWDQTRAFFLWRALTQWLGGLGVIALFIVILPRLGIAGRQLFFAEASTAASDAVSPQVRHGARKLWRLYVVLTLLEVVALAFCGMSVYEGVVHAFTTMSAGGFSPNPQSIAGYASPSIEWVIIVFMVLSGTSFTLQYRAFTGRPRAFLQDAEFVVYALVTLGVSLGIAFLLVGGLPGLADLRTALFQVASVISSTGYASVDFEQWSQSIKALLVVAMIVGGCAGSACGGPKVVRYLFVGKFLRREVTQVLHPRAVIPLRYRGSPIPSEALRAVLNLVAMYLTGYLVLGVVVTLLEPRLDMMTAFSASLACMGNIGPAFGEAGPMGSYAAFSAPGKVLLAIAMWVGRLEILSVVALLHPHVWRELRWGASRAGGALTPPSPPPP